MILAAHYTSSSSDSSAGAAFLILMALAVVLGVVTIGLGIWASMRQGALEKRIAELEMQNRVDAELGKDR